MMLRLILLVFFVIIHLSYTANSFPTPLLLTPYLEAGKVKEAQEKARIVPDVAGVKSYSGYFTVNKDCGNHLFFWFLPAENAWQTAPVLLWLNGGPGSSSLIGMFQEIGPFDHVKKGGLKKRKYHWANHYNVIFLDQPVGTGFSFTEKECYADNMTIASQEAYLGLVQFFKLFPDLQHNIFFVTGESFGGHSIPALACEIHHKNSNAAFKINLKGIVVGNPAIDDRCHHNGEFLYEMGIVDEKVRDILIKHEETLTMHINEKKYLAAANISTKIYGEVVYNIGMPSVYNILYDKRDLMEFQFYIRSYEIRKQIHVGNTPYNALNIKVYDHLEDDIYIPSVSYIEQLLQTNKYIVGFYSGHLDFICLYTSLPCVLRKLKWSGAVDYMAANRSLWYVDDRLAGWFKVAGNLFEVVIRDSGHFVPTDQPRVALELITAAVSDTPGSKLLTKLQTKPPLLHN